MISWRVSDASRIDKAIGYDAEANWAVDAQPRRRYGTILVNLEDELAATVVVEGEVERVIREVLVPDLGHRPTVLVRSIPSGFNIYPGEDEGVIRSLPEVDEVVVVGAPARTTGRNGHVHGNPPRRKSIPNSEHDHFI